MVAVLFHPDLKEMEMGTGHNGCLNASPPLLLIPPKHHTLFVFLSRAARRGPRIPK